MTNIYTFYTHSHKEFIDDWFLKTIDPIDKDKLHIEKFEQECETGAFMSPGWNDTMLKKVDYIRDCLRSDDLHFHLDSDIQFFQPFSEDYTQILIDQDLDILAQHDGFNTVCCGFMLIRSNESTKRIFDEVHEMTKTGAAANDQMALNALIQNGNHKEVKVGLLGRDCWSIWMTGQRTGAWEPYMGCGEVPKDIKVHHANYCVGIDNKINLMEQVREKVMSYANI